MLAADVDIRGFSRFVEGLQHALIGTGQTGDLMAVVKSEVRQLAWEISRQIGYRDLESGKKGIASDVGKVFRPGPFNSFLLDSSRQSKAQPYRILTATSRYLVVVNEEDASQPELGAEFMQRALRANQKAGYPRGNAWTNLGRVRGNPKQHVMYLNRILVTRERYAALVDRLGKRLGRLQATFAYAAAQLGFTKVPAWISKHFASVKADGAAVFRFRMEGQGVSAIEFGSRARGVTSNAHIVEKIHKSVERRKAIALDKIRKILSGYKYNWETGAVFRTNAGEQMLKQLDDNAAAFDALP